MLLKQGFIFWLRIIYLHNQPLAIKRGEERYSKKADVIRHDEWRKTET